MGVVPDLIVEAFAGVAAVASPAGSVAGVDEVDERSCAPGVAAEVAPAMRVFAERHHPADRRSEAAVEALDHVIGPWRSGPGPAMVYSVIGAEPVDDGDCRGDRAAPEHPHLGDR